MFDAGKLLTTAPTPHTQTTLPFRFSNDGTVWACLAALAMAAGELPTAEVAFAAIDAADKLQYVLHLRGLASAGAGAGAAAGSDPVVAAELLLCAGQTQEAEAKLLQVCC
jgi:intraflagellar transport protein 80